jgi:hypothetical protein
VFLALGALACGSRDSSSDALCKLLIAYRTRPDNTLDDSAMNAQWNGTTVIAPNKAVAGSESWVRQDAVV